MDSPENIIYVILVIGSIIWGIVKKFLGKKEETAQPQPAQTSDPKKSLEEIFRELAGEIEPQPQPAVFQPIAQLVPQPVLKSQPVMNDAFASKSIVKTLPQQQETPQQYFSVDLENVSDWQRAFVYSEIFNKKY